MTDRDMRDSIRAIVVLLVTTVLVVVAVVGIARWVRPDRTIPVRTYNGVTWQGDECRVIEDLEVLVCRGRENLDPWN